ncbi:helix-turn-helix domain-containing protein [Aquabacterium sp.]|uniref:helix-turn-helix domain-containing protein n=1 Tax=Aquabacterium sp. TaxID=1872578 RepID=UPI00261C4B26|nr:helix-turn-helix domain-containing protein [Aquabacterium sp.]MDD2978141.1 helix-turn-helix domain-containing protein [Aquabacterium sp.]
MTPTPAQIRAARESAGLSQEAAAALIHKTRSAWAQWEARESASNHRAMDPAFWELFLLKIKQKSPE